MYNVIIVDDEPSAAKLLKHYVDKFADGFTVKDVFKDGNEVVNYLLYHNDVDVVLTDICMKNMSGVDLAKYIHYAVPSIKVVLVSAYTDFEYAKNAFKYGVCGYLLKVVDVEELKTLMRQIKTELDRKSHINTEDIDSERERLFGELLTGRIKKRERLLDMLSKCGFSDVLTSSVLKVQFRETNQMLEHTKSSGQDKMARSIAGIVRFAVKGGVVVPISICSEGSDCYIGIVDGEFDAGEIQTVLADMFGLSVEIESVDLNSFGEYLEESMQTYFNNINSRNESESKIKERQERLEEAKKYINEHLSENISRDTVAGMLHLESTYFGKFFKRYIGKSFSEYVTEQRMELAKELLKNGMQTMEACAEVGYADEKHFRQLFKKCTGMTPYEWRKNAETES